MKTTKIIALAVVSGTLAASIITTPVLAWHPKGTIKKYVQNQTTGSALADANDATSAVTAKPGDIVKYVIEVSNTGTAASNNYNDMHFTKLTDTLPAGVELVSNPTQRTITEDLGIVKPGQKVTREYLVKVTSTKNADVITNKACFTGDSEVKDAPQNGCDPAVIKVSVPPVVPPKTPEPPVTPELPAELPHTGASAFVATGAAVGTGILGYAISLFAAKRRDQ
jgi:uncharacterized repeat protein (TIGR01451 family)